ncbi:MAG TPA: hypothetical protein VNS22_12375 [Geminicoccus sp.]|nr:hypothetical protein [Geminicoccus sp.]HWL69168.1 hypothetical protein [Geminicoccus sp.]
MKPLAIFLTISAAYFSKAKMRSAAPIMTRPVLSSAAAWKLL